MLTLIGPAQHHRVMTDSHSIEVVSVEMRDRGHLSGWQRWRVSYRQWNKRLGWHTIFKYVSDRDARKFCKNHRLSSPVPGTAMVMSNLAAK